MSQPFSNTPTSAPSTSNLARRPLRRRPPHNGSLEPISLARRRPLLSPSSLLFFAGMAVFGLYAQGRLPGVDRFFDDAQNFGRAHNDVVVGTILRVVPVVLVFFAAAVLITSGFFALRNRRRSPFVSAIEENTRPAALPITARQGDLAPAAIIPQEEANAEEPVVPVTVQADPEGVTPGKPILVMQHAVAAAETSLSAGEEEAEAPSTQIAEVLRRAEPRVHEHSSGSVPTLPAMPRVRRPKARSTLSPAVIATLKREIAKRTLTR